MANQGFDGIAAVEFTYWLCTCGAEYHRGDPLPVAHAPDCPAGMIEKDEKEHPDG